MDSTSELTKRGDAMEALARELFDRAHNLVDAPDASPARELARSIAYWLIAIRRLAQSGADAWAVSNARFPHDPGDGPPSAIPDAPYGPPEMVAELDLIVAYLVGDQVLEDFAFAELTRRRRAPIWTPGGKVPGLWLKLMKVVDADPNDPLTADARYLDATLAPARDVLIVHRDPGTYRMPMFSTLGRRISRAPRHERRTAGTARLRTSGIQRIRTLTASACSLKG